LIKGFSFIKFENKEGYEAALKLNEEILLTKKIKINPSKSRIILNSFQKELKLRLKQLKKFKKPYNEDNIRLGDIDNKWKLRYYNINHNLLNEDDLISLSNKVSCSYLKGNIIF
jgi:hypothetical protein